MTYNIYLIRDTDNMAIASVWSDIELDSEVQKIIYDATDAIDQDNFTVVKVIADSDEDKAYKLDLIS